MYTYTQRDKYILTDIRTCKHTHILTCRNASLGSLHRSAGGPAALSAAVEHGAREGCHFIACLAVVEAIGWYADVGGFSAVDWAIADQQLRPGCVMKSIQCEELVKELRLLSQSYSFRHAVMLRWL